MGIPSTFVGDVVRGPIQSPSQSVNASCLKEEQEGNNDRLFLLLEVGTDVDVDVAVAGAECIRKLIGALRTSVLLTLEPLFRTSWTKI
jgi:hypothetical protein